MDGTPNLNEISAKIFIDHCKEKFGWGDLSNDVIMDVGCGEEGFCTKAILDKFPEVGAIIAFDSNPNVFRNFKLRSATKVRCVFADIKIRESLQNYEGRMTKVISTRVFHQLMEKEEAFCNMYHLLKPGGEAAVLFFIKSLIYEWLTELLKNPKWKKAYQREYVENLYKKEFGAEQYKEMVEKIGFQVIECSEEKRVIPYPSDQVCKESLFKMCKENFKVLPEDIEEFKEECFQVLLKLSARDVEGRPCYRSTELSLLLVKPTEGAASETKGNPGS